MLYCEFKVNFLGKIGFLGYRNYIEDIISDGYENIIRDVEEKKNTSSLYENKYFLQCLKKEFKNKIEVKCTSIENVVKDDENLKVKINLQFLLYTFFDAEKEITLSRVQLEEAYKEVENKKVTGFFGMHKEDEKYVNGGLDYLIENMKVDKYCDKKIKVVIGIALRRKSLIEKLKDEIEIMRVQNIKLDMSFKEFYEK